MGGAGSTYWPILGLLYGALAAYSRQGFAPALRRRASQGRAALALRPLHGDGRRACALAPKTRKGLPWLARGGV